MTPAAGQTPHAGIAPASYSRSMGFGALSFGVLAVLSVGSSIAIARIYGIRVLGEYALVIAAVNAVTLLSSARERPALVRELAKLAPRQPRVSGLFFPVLGFSALLTLVVGAVVVLVAQLVYAGAIGRPGLVAPTAVAIASFVMLENTNANLDGVFTSFRAGRELLWIRVAQAVAMLVGAVALGLLDTGLWGLVGATVGAQAFALAHRLVLVRRYMPLRAPRTELRDGVRELPGIIRFGLKIAPGGLADGVSNESGTWVLGITASIVSVGAYGRAWMIARQLMLLNVRVTEMLFPTLVSRRDRADHAGAQRALVDTLRYAAAGLLLIGAVGGGAAEGIMALFGPGFGQASDALALLLCVPALLTLAQVQRHALYALDRPWLGTASAMCRLTVTLGAGIPLAIAMGPTGAALGVVAGLVADLAFGSLQVLVRMPGTAANLLRARELLSLAAAYGLGFAASHHIYGSVRGLGGTALALAGGVLVYACIILIALRERDVARLRMLRGLLRRRGPASPTAGSAHS